jgi:hypothetical protein
MLRRYLMLLLALLCLVAVAGCGSGGNSETSGTLSLSVTPTDLTGGQFNIEATAVYQPAPGTSNTSVPAVTPQGVPITITMAIHTLNGAPFIISQELFTDSSGTVTLSRNVGQISEVTYVDVTAKTGGLSQSRSVAVPALTPAP